MKMKIVSVQLAFALSALLIGSLSALAQLPAVPAERPLHERVHGREYPSVFQAWSPAQNIDDALAQLSPSFAPFHRITHLSW